MAKDFYDILWVSKTATADEIKKAYRKLAMKYHPDRAKWDKKEAEKKFKELWEAYETLSNPEKRKQYDMFWKAWWNPFSWAWWAWASWFWWFEDIFWQAARWWGWWGINFEDLFWWFTWKARTSWDPFWWQYEQQTRQEPKKEESLDFEKTYEVPFFDFLLWWKLEVRWVYWQTKTIKIPAWTKPGTKMRIKWFGKKEWSKEGNLIVKLDAKMPKYISEMDKQMLERIKEWVGY